MSMAQSFDACRLIPYMREAFLMYERGDATVRSHICHTSRMFEITWSIQAEDIDTAMRLGAGYRKSTYISESESIDTSAQSSAFRNPFSVARCWHLSSPLLLVLVYPEMLNFLLCSYGSSRADGSCRIGHRFVP